MNSRTRNRSYPIIVKRDGEYCRCCGALPSERELVIDHRDNNNSNNELSNLQLLCKACNYLKNPRQPIDSCVSVRRAPEVPSELEVNRTKEPLFKEYLTDRFEIAKSIPMRELVNSSAEVLGISPITTRRYLDKSCSNEGEYEMMLDGKTITIIPKASIPPSGMVCA